MNLTNYLQAKFEKIALKQFLKPVPSLAEVLPYEDFISHKNSAYMLLKNGKLGGGFSVIWPNHLTTSDKSLLELEDSVARFLQRIDPGYLVQFQLEKLGGSFFGHFFLITPKIEAAIAFRPKHVVKLSYLSFQEKIESLYNLLNSFASAVTSEGAIIKNLAEPDWLKLISHRLGDFFTEEKSLRSLASLGGAVSHESLKIGENNYEVIVPVEVPAKLSSQVLRPLYFEDSNFIISAGLRILSKEEVEARINQRKFWLQNALGAGAARQREEIESFEKEFTSGERLIAGTFAVITDNKTNASQIKNILNQSTQSEWAIESAGASKVILDALPLNHDSGFMEKIGRCIYLPSFACSKMLPISTASVSKEPNKALQYLTPEGEMSGFDLRNTPGCHTAVIAGTRSGKSFLVANLLYRYLSSDKPPVVSIIDKRASYETLTSYFDGSVIAFSPERLKSPDFPFHPLAGALDEQHIEFLCSYVSLLAELAKPDEPVYAVDKVVITDAIRNAIEAVKISLNLAITKEANTTQALTMSDIASALGRSESPAARTLVQRLRPYYGNGTYAVYFDREYGDTQSEANIMSFDLDGLESDKLLQSAMSSAILGQIMARMRKASNQGRWGILLVEEIGVLGDSVGGLSQFVADAWKTMAKMGVVCIGVTNDVEDYLHKPAAKAIWNNSPNKLYLRMTHDQIRSLVTSNNHGPAVVGGQLAELLPCLKTIPGDKADFIVSAEDKILPLVFKPDPMSYWLGTSRHEDIIRLKALTKSMTVQQAIAELIQK